MSGFAHYLREVRNAPPASDESIKNFLTKFPDCPQDFIDLHSTHDEFQVFLGSSVFSLWPLDEISSLNEGHAVDEFAPGLLMFASNGGLSAYAYNTLQSDWPIVEADFIGIDEFRFVGANLLDLFEKLSSR